MEYGIKRYNALFILESLLNLREIKIYDSKRKYDEESTIAALEKQNHLLETFKKWIWEDEDRRWEVEEEYNKIFNKYKKKRFDGSGLVFPEMKEGVDLFGYQKDAVQAIIEKDNTLLAFDVGAGKTYIMITAAMLMRQQGISRKNMFVVPNNIVGQWEKIFTDLYPKARLLVIEPKSFKAPVREKTMKLMKHGDYDGIIIAFSCFDMIPLSVDFINESMKENISRIDLAISQVGYAIGSRAALDRAKKNIIGMVDELISSMEYESVNVSFDELGINTLFVDAEVKALALSNPRMKDLAEKENRLANLRILSGKYRESIEQIEEDIKICEKTKSILKREIAVITEIIPNICVKSEKDYKELRATCQEIFAEKDLTKLNQHLGLVWGFGLETTEREYKKPSIYLVRNDAKFLLEVGDTALGNATRVSHFFEKLPVHVEELKDRLTEKDRQITEYNKNLQENNPYIVEIKELDEVVRNLKREIYETKAC